ncbi:MAG: hypothetical protein B9S26_02180 [Opitutia bacterium Tous-C4FEB]|jgi:uncharacterized protein YdbL (DUF1318 family)|nr:YdbL family protein [Verrucomicrobiota bacterium]PAW74009.1 MAG: hypothetical protein B9S35_03650 [Opitutae bacterium Tous-C5TDCM]PAW90800.1 MAG: hypothetical protein B9S26_02180 [Opitutae bacterium Tous-C4FEB]
MKSILLRICLLVGLLSAGVVAARAAEDLGAVKARLAQRLGSLDQLKSSGAVGETNRGLVDLRAASPAAGDLVAAENRDRGIVYAAIAQQTGSTVETVGRARAKQIAAASAPGVWVQRESGEWYKK